MKADCEEVWYHLCYTLCSIFGKELLFSFYVETRFIYDYFCFHIMFLLQEFLSVLNVIMRIQEGLKGLLCVFICLIYVYHSFIYPLFLHLSISVVSPIY